MSSIYDNYPAVRYVDEYDKDTDELCIKCKGNCGFIGITGMWACKGFVPMTNADRIRAMTDEELAEYIDLHAADAMWCKSPPNDCPPHETCGLCILAWLRSPMEVDK